MTANGPDLPSPSEEPPSSSPGPPGPPRPRKGGSLTLGILLGVLMLLALYFVAFLLTGPSPNGFRAFGGAAVWLPLVLYLLAAVVLTLRPATSRFGAGLLIGTGVWLLIGGAMCISSLTGVGAT